jgi:hypothetical protein
MKKIAGMTTLLLLTWTSSVMAAREEAYVFGQGLQTLVRQQQLRPEDRQSTEKLYFIPAQPKKEGQEKDEKAETWTMTKKGNS